MKILLSITLLIPSLALASEALLLFGGRSHDEFMGCLNCGRYDDGSVCNKYGEYGSRYSDKSIWNRYGDYGSKYSDKSPWNKHASYPPVIVDKDGGFYGYFTANTRQRKRTKIEFYAYMLDRADIVIDDLDKARDWFCED